MGCEDRHFPPAGLALYNISFSYETCGSLLRALECAREALRIWQTALPPSHPHVKMAQELVRQLEGDIARHA